MGSRIPGRLARSLNSANSSTIQLTLNQPAGVTVLHRGRCVPCQLAAVSAPHADTSLSAPAVGCATTALNVGHCYHAVFSVNIKEKPPVANSAAKGGLLMGEPGHVSGQGIVPHLIECADEAFSIRTSGASEPFSRALCEDDFPRITGCHRVC